MNKLTIALTLFISVPILCFILYEYPVEKHLANREIEEYMKNQGISEETIESKKYLKDYKQGGYEISVELMDDPGIIYQYSWVKSRGVVLLVFKGGSGMDTGVKYPPLE
ncbi:DUF3139 domain-containing protein [Mesobacillus jeotgali]|uniref:DUF3139 domain-containing protein n=1 Tax=Mesobacillus jeotgali TaxID=129985 RepID=UPI000C865AB0|nr:DUF3139 domain-containing protein [Mesobacillus jeotgali]